MKNDRLLELAGIKKAVGEVNSILNESNDARTFVRGLSLYKDLMKDKKAKPEALKVATQFVKDFGSDKITPNAKKWIQDELSDVAHKHNPGGAMISPPDEKEESGEEAPAKETKKAAPPKEEVKKKAPNKRGTSGNAGGGRKAPSEARTAARKWLQSHPNATAKEFVAAATKIGLVQSNARAMFYREKKKMKTNEAYVIRQVNSKKYLSERGHLLNPKWIGANEFIDDYFVCGTLYEAERIRDSLILHSREKMEIVNLDDEC